MDTVTCEKGSSENKPVRLTSRDYKVILYGLRSVCYGPFILDGEVQM